MGSGAAVRPYCVSTVYRLLILPAPQLRHPRQRLQRLGRAYPLLQLWLTCPLFNTPGHAVYAVRICLLAARHSASQNLGAEYGAAKEGRSGGWNQ